MVLSGARLDPLIAPVIDRLVIAVHRAGSERGRALAQRLGLIQFGFLIELRLALPVRPVSPAGVRAITRYAASADVESSLVGHAQDGLVTIGPDGSIDATDRSREFYTELFPLHDEVATELWTARADTLPALGELTNRVLLEGIPTGGDAVGATTPPYEPPGAGPALLLFNRLAALRYHRADAHAAAWSAAGLTAAE
ncbi:MAG: hypothetical protein ACR2JK_04245 [Geodermatophilaceae bacterium]